MQQKYQLELIKLKASNFLDKLQQSFRTSYSLVPKNLQLYEKKKSELLQQLKSHQFDSDILINYESLLLGSLEGHSGKQNPVNIIQENICKLSDQKLINFVRKKIQIRYYGFNRNKQFSVIEVKNTSIFNQLFDEQFIKKQRKMNCQFRTYCKALKNFEDMHKNLIESDKQSIHKVFKHLTKLQQEEEKFNKINTKTINLKKSQCKLIDQQQKKIEYGQQQQKIQNKNIIITTPKKAISSKKIVQKNQISDETIKKNRKKQDKQENNLFNYFTKRIQNFTISNKKQDLIENQSPFDRFNQNSSKTDNLIQIINNDPLEKIENLIKQFQFIPKQESDQKLSYYSNIFIINSEIQYCNYPVQNIDKKISLQMPFEEFQDVRYHEDSYDQYEEVYAEICSDEVISEESQESSNSTIVPHGYLSGDQISSQSQSGIKKIQIQYEEVKGGQWSYSHKKLSEENIKYQIYSIICLTEKNIPLQLEENNEESISFQTKIQLYKQIHGSFDGKDQLIKKLQNITDKIISRRQLEKILKETTLKRANQRLVREEIIQQLKDNMPNIGQQLQDILFIRDREAEKIRDEKKSGRETKIQQILLQKEQYETIIELIKILREAGLKMTKKEIKKFLEQKVNSQFIQIKQKLFRSNSKSRPNLEKYNIVNNHETFNKNILRSKEFMEVE